MSITKSPLDFDELEKGDVITAEMIESAMNCKVGTNDFDFKMMDLRKMIFRKRKFICKSQNNNTELKILTSEESIGYTDKLAKQALNKYGNAFEYGRSINIEELSEASKRRLENQLINQGRVQQAIRRERRKINGENKQKQLTE